MTGRGQRDMPTRPDEQRGVEGADYSPGFCLDWWQHPHANAAQVCASGVWHLMAPQSPEADRWKTWFHYSQGPEAFTGDLHFYSVGSRSAGPTAGHHGTRCPVVMLTGDHAYLRTPGDGARTDGQIQNSEFIEMKGIGHFPMSENHELFRTYLIRALDVLKRKTPAVAAS